jgi:predicted phage tail protein
MRRLMIVALVVMMGGLSTMAQAQAQVQTQAQTQPRAAAPAPAVAADGSDFGLHPVLLVVAGAVSGVILASAVAGSLVVGSMLLEGVPLAESLEAGTGLSVPAIGASAVLGGLIGHLLFSR